MNIKGKLKSLRKGFFRELKVYRLVLKDPRTPKIGKWFLGITIAYAISPLDIIPDFIPILGYLDDIIILPLLIFFALKTIPKEVILDCRKKVENNSNEDSVEETE